MASSINGRLQLLIVTILFGWMAATAESQQVSEQQPVRSAWPSIIPGETAVTRNVRSALKLMLESMDKTLTFVIRNEVLWITTHDAEPVQRRVYNVAKLLGDQESATELAAALSGAIEMVGSHEVQITPFGRLLIVRGGQQSHDQLAELLAAMYQGITANQASDTRPKAAATDEQEHEHQTSDSSDEP